VALEDKADTIGDIRAAQVPGFDGETVSYNMRLLIQASLIEGNCSGITRAPLSCFASAMTWDGHELFDKMRTDSFWNKIKTTAREKAIPLSFEAIKILAGEIIKNLV
jgi:hypothetical protein